MLKINSWWQSLNKAMKICLISLTIAAFGLGTTYYCYYAGQTIASDQAPAEIKGSVITLKALKEEYFADLHHMFSNEVRKGLDFPAVIDFAYSIAYFRHLEHRAHVSKGILYTIFDNVDQAPIGTIEIREYDPEDVGQMGMWINEKYWGGGRTVEAIKLISKAYFNLYPSEKDFIIFARPWNQRSYKALLKAGCVDEGFKYCDGTPIWYQLRKHKE